MELIFIVIAFLLLILAVVWAPFIKQQESNISIDDTQRDETNVRLYHEHKAEIEKILNKIILMTKTISIY